ncbi:MAG: glutamine-hydrolyzing carbamoyl-phosphate synthase small subunit [Desulfobacteraceae bacterium]
MKALLALEDGRTFSCKSFTGDGEAEGEVVFNTSMTGYQEILTDPSYVGQMVTLTYPLIGNYGVCPEDTESAGIQAAALIVREYQGYPSNWRSTGDLASYLKKAGVIGIEELDTRALVRHIRKGGAMRGVISTQELDPAVLVRRACRVEPMEGCDLVSRVTTKTPYFWHEGRPDYLLEDTPLDSSIWRYREKHAVVAFDFGIKYNIIRCLEDAGCEVLVVPADTGAETVKQLEPDGIFLSNGPGDPEPVTYAIRNIRELAGYAPMFGICLGMQLLALALNASTYKIKFGHRGGNQPVKNIETGRVEITAQNHGFAVEFNSFDKDDFEMTHVNLNEKSVEGVRKANIDAFAVQYHPEASPGPHDAAYLFNQFARMMKNAKTK